LVEYSIDDVGELLDSIFLGKYKDAFRKEEIAGGKLSLCEDIEVLKAYGITSEGDAMLLLDKLNKLKQTSGTIELFIFFSLYYH